MVQNWWQTQQPHYSSDNEEDCPDYNMSMNRRNTSSRSGAFSHQPHRRSNQSQPPPPPLDGASVALGEELGEFSFVVDALGISAVAVAMTLLGRLHSEKITKNSKIRTITGCLTLKRAF